VIVIHDGGGRILSGLPGRQLYLAHPATNPDSGTGGMMRGEVLAE